MMRIMFFILLAGVLLAGGCSSQKEHHSEEKHFAKGPLKVQWKDPVIKGYGKEHYLPDAAVQPDTSLTYKVIFSITLNEDYTKPNRGLVHMARLINLLRDSGMPPEKIDIVAMITGPATPVALSDSTYHRIFKTDNPNTRLLEELNQDGEATLFVCGQAVTGAGYDEHYLNPNVEMALSALVTIPTYEMKGYALMNF